MSHSVKVTLIADQEIKVRGRDVNVHDIKSIIVDGEGRIVDIAYNDDRGWMSEVWLTEICRYRVADRKEG